jgi:hypothetical protein
LWRTFYRGGKCSREQSVLRSKVFQEAKCAGEQSVSGRNCSRDENVLRSKMFLEGKYESAKCAKQKNVLGSKVCVSRKILTEIKT